MFRTPALIATTLIIMGVILWAVDRFAPHERPLAEMRWTHALLFGLAQVLALVPGVSRSGSTMTAGRAMGFHRESAAVFAFLRACRYSRGRGYEVTKAIAEGGLGSNCGGVIASALSGWWRQRPAQLRRAHAWGVRAYRIVLGLLLAYANAR